MGTIPAERVMMADENFNLPVFASAFGVSVLSSAVPAWMARGGKEGRTVVVSAAATAILLGGVYGIPAVFASYWPSIAAITIGLVGWTWTFARRRYPTPTSPKAASQTSPIPDSASARDPFVVLQLGMPTIYVQDDREPAIIGLAIVVANASVGQLMVQSAMLSLAGDNSGIVTDRLVTLNAVSLPLGVTSVPLGDVGLSNAVANRLRKKASDCISLSVRIELQVQDAAATRRLQATATTWARVVKALEVSTSTGSPTSINIHGSHIGGDLVGRDKKQ